jgi:hypothetical protein
MGKKDKIENLILSEDLIKIADLTNETGKLLETNLKYQILTSSIFIAYLLGHIDIKKDGFKIFENTIPFDVLEYTCPIILFYLLTKASVYTISFIDSGEYYYAKSKKHKHKVKSNIFRPRSLFLCLILMANSKMTFSKIIKKIYKLKFSYLLKNRVDVLRYSLNLGFAILLYSVSGINLGLTYYSIINFTEGMISNILLTSATLLTFGMYYEFSLVKNFEKYIVVPYISFAIAISTFIFTCFFKIILKGTIWSYPIF